ncbi:MAG: hypothetical protein AAF483_27190, partial [Planctomycetota bacterium]
SEDQFAVAPERKPAVVESHHQRRPKAWDTVMFTLDGSANAKKPNSRIYENRNVRDFHWELIEGANREIPFRLSFLERLAEKSMAFGLLLYCKRWIADCFQPLINLCRIATQR